MLQTKSHIHKSKTAEISPVFLSSFGNNYSYADLDTFTLSLKSVLDDLLTGDDNKVAFLSESSDALVMGIAACWKLGIAFIPLSPKLSDREINVYMERLQPDLIFSDAENMGRVNDQKVICLDDKYVKFLLNHRSKDEPSVMPNDINQDKTAGYFFTSGSTGEPKIVPVKRRQVISAAKSSAYNFKPDRNHYWVLCLPLNHTGGITVILRSLLYGSAVFRLDEFNEYTIKSYLGNNELFQVISLVPTMLYRLLKDSKFKTHRRFKTILLGGDAVSKSLLLEVQTRGIPVVSSYGMTETCGQIAANPVGLPSGVYVPLQSVGRIFHPNKIQIRDEKQRALGKNQFGSVWLKGPQVFDGYLDERHNEGRFDNDGWFNTGDYGRLNLFGALFIESRSNDLIISGGENINPKEIEQEILKLPVVNEAVIVGGPDEEWGQRIIAFITLKNGDVLSIDDLREQLRPNLQSFKLPKELHIITEFPRTDLGKIKRSELLKLL